DHTVAGNPMRFHQGRLDLRLDQAWTTKLPERDRKVVTAITWPLQVRYGYSQVRKAHRKAQKDSK
ncbi:MAG TPA: sulfotransferase, partial [Acidimicrobiia bacterium]|nr:sulfotransferase [Acidimicrobiia bacterium]